MAKKKKITITIKVDSDEKAEALKELYKSIKPVDINEENNDSNKKK